MGGCDMGGVKCDMGGCDRKLRGEPQTTCSQLI